MSHETFSPAYAALIERFADAATLTRFNGYWLPAIILTDADLAVCVTEIDDLIPNALDDTEPQQVAALLDPACESDLSIGVLFKARLRAAAADAVKADVRAELERREAFQADTHGPEVYCEETSEYV